METTHQTISVVIPLYNGARFIRQALDSVFSQTLPAREVIVVDDGSTDNGGDIVAQYALSHPLELLHQPNAGQASARNLGIRRSRGPLIALLDQDDVWYPDHLSELSRPFAEDRIGTLGWTYGNVDQITADNRMCLHEALSESRITHPKKRLSTCLGEDMFVLPSASMIARTAFDAVDGFDERLCGYEDDDFFLRLFCAGFRNVYTPRSLTQWRVFSTSTSYSSRMAVSRMVYVRKLLAMFPDEPEHRLFYARDLIAPRFLRQVVAQTRIALRSGCQDAIDTCLSDIAFLERHVDRHTTRYRKPDDILITAVVPLYNGAPFIVEALNSILTQVLPPDEIIVVDDGSTDDGPAIVADYARKHPIRLITKANGGQSSARNAGVDQARGDLIAFLDQDDVWYPNHLSELVKPFLKPWVTELGWVYSDLDQINEAGEMICHKMLRQAPVIEHPKQTLAGCLTTDMFVLPSASLISRKAFLRIGGFDERLSGYEDDDLFLRLFQAGYDNAFLRPALSKWRTHRSSSSYSPRMAVSRLAYARILISRFPDDPLYSLYYTGDLIAPRFFKLMAAEFCYAVQKGDRRDRQLALKALGIVTEHLRPGRRILIKLFVLPALKIPPLGRFIVRHRSILAATVRRFVTLR